MSDSRLCLLGSLRTSRPFCYTFITPTKLREQWCACATVATGKGRHGGLVHNFVETGGCGARDWGNGQINQWRIQGGKGGCKCTPLWAASNTKKY